MAKAEAAAVSRGRSSARRTDAHPVEGDKVAGSTLSNGPQAAPVATAVVDSEGVAGTPMVDDRDICTKGIGDNAITGAETNTSVSAVTGAGPPVDANALGSGAGYDEVAVDSRNRRDASGTIGRADAGTGETRSQSASSQAAIESSRASQAQSQVRSPSQSPAQLRQRSPAQSPAHVLTWPHSQQMSPLQQREQSRQASLSQSQQARQQRTQLQSPSHSQAQRPPLQLRSPSQLTPLQRSPRADSESDAEGGVHKERLLNMPQSLSQANLSMLSHVKSHTQLEQQALALSQQRRS